MSPRTWLPPLNSHNSYTTSVSFRHFNAGKCFGRILIDAFFITVHVAVEFTSSMKKKPFPGLHLNLDKLYIPCCKITSSSSSSEAEDILYEILYTMSVPFELDKIIFKGSTDSGTSRHVNDFQDLATIIQNILYNGINSDMRSFRLDILKSVVIPEHEYDAWTSWYSEKREADPSFLWEYMSGIFRTRTDEELLDENQALEFKNAPKTSIDELLKDIVKVDSCGSSKDCLICLEELPPQSKAIRLLCAHVFHEGCIVKWLQESNSCPLCRSLLSSA